MMRRILSKFRNFWRQPRFARLWFFPVWLLLGLARALILCVPFQRLAPRLGRHAGAAPWVPVLDAAHQRRAQQIGQVVRLAARYTPWTSNCFPQAVAARVLLGLYRVPYVLCFGVTRTPDSANFQAHAWVVSGRVAVSGGPSFDRYVTVGVFADPRLSIE